MLGERLTVRFTVSRIANNTIGNRQDICVIAKPVSICRVAKFLWRYLQRVAPRIQADKVNGIALWNRYDTVQRQKASPMVRMCIAQTFADQPIAAATQRGCDQYCRLQG